MLFKSKIVNMNGSEVLNETCVSFVEHTEVYIQNMYSVWLICYTEE